MFGDHHVHRCCGLAAAIGFWTGQVDGERAEQGGDEHAWNTRVLSAGVVTPTCSGDGQDRCLQLWYGVAGVDKRKREYQLLAGERAMVFPSVGFQDGG